MKKREFSSHTPPAATDPSGIPKRRSLPPKVISVNTDAHPAAAPKIKALAQAGITVPPRTAAPVRLRKQYEKKVQCAFVTPTGDRCQAYATGKSTLCISHGGSSIIKENLLKDTELTPDILRMTKYEPTIHPLKFIQLSAAGNSLVEIAAAFQVSETALRKWGETYETFNNAMEIGLAAYETWWIKEGKAALKDRMYNNTLYKFLTGNKLGYSDKVEQRTYNQNVHGVMLVPAKMDAATWEAQALAECVEAISEDV